MQRINCNVYTATIYQIAMAFLLLWITRIGFYYYKREFGIRIFNLRPIQRI